MPLREPESPASLAASPMPEPTLTDEGSLAHDQGEGLSASTAASSSDPAIGDFYLQHMYDSLDHGSSLEDVTDRPLFLIFRVFYFDTLALWEENDLSELDVEQDVSDELAAFGPQGASSSLLLRRRPVG